MYPSPPQTAAYALLLGLLDGKRREELAAALDEATVQGLLDDLTEAAMDDPVLYASDPGELADRLLEHPDPFRWIVGRVDLPHQAVAKELLARSRAASDAEAAAHAARLAHDLLETALGPEPPDGDLETAAAVQLAESSVRLGHIRDAAETLERYSARIPHCRAKTLRGDLHLSAATVRDACGQHSAALAHIGSAIDAYVELLDRSRLARALIRAASILRAQGQLREALEFLEDACRLVTPEHAAVYLAAHHNRASYLIDAGKPESARAILDEIAPLYLEPELASYLSRHRWLIARLAEASGDIETAAETYERLYRDLLDTANPRDATLVAVDLARLWLTSAQPDELPRALAKLRYTFRLAGSPGGTRAETIVESFERDAAPSTALLDELSALIERPHVIDS